MKYYIIKTTKNGISYRLNKCHTTYWVTNFSACWQFSEAGARKICDKENRRLKEIGITDCHYNYVAVDKTWEMHKDELNKINLIIGYGNKAAWETKGYKVYGFN